MNKLITYLNTGKYAIYIVIWRFLLSIFGRLIKFNNTCAKTDDKILIRYENKRHKGKVGTVIERAKHEFDESNKKHKYRSNSLVTVKFYDGMVAYNFRAKDYIILLTSK